MNSVLNDLVLEDINEINNIEQQQEIEKIMIKKNMALKGGLLWIMKNKFYIV